MMIMKFPFCLEMFRNGNPMGRFSSFPSDTNQRALKQLFEQANLDGIHYDFPFTDAAVASTPTGGLSLSSVAEFPFLLKMSKMNRGPEMVRGSALCRLMANPGKSATIHQAEVVW